jgi:hypothetical protein
MVPFYHYDSAFGDLPEWARSLLLQRIHLVSQVFPSIPQRLQQMHQDDHPVVPHDH